MCMERSKTVFLLALFLAGLGALYSCKKNDGTKVDFQSPVKGGTYQDPVNVVATFTNPAVKIEFVKIRIYRKSSPAQTVYAYEKEVNAKELAIGEQFEANVTAPTPFVMEYETGYKIQVKGAYEFMVTP